MKPGSRPQNQKPNRFRTEPVEPAVKRTCPNWNRVKTEVAEQEPE